MSGPQFWPDFLSFDRLKRWVSKSSFAALAGYDGTASGSAKTTVQGAIDEARTQGGETLHSAFPDLVTSGHPAGIISVVATPTNYAAGSGDVEAHLVGIDDALGSVSGGWDRNAIHGYLYPSTLTDKVVIGTTDAPLANLHINGSTVYRNVNVGSLLRSSGTYAAQMYEDSTATTAALFEMSSGEMRMFTKASAGSFIASDMVAVFTTDNKVGIGFDAGIGIVGASLHTVGSGSTSDTYCSKDQNSEGDGIIYARDDRAVFQGAVEVEPLDAGIEPGMFVDWLDSGVWKRKSKDNLGVVTTVTLG